MGFIDEFELQMMGVMLNLMDVILKMMDFTLKMMNFTLIRWVSQLHAEVEAMKAHYAADNVPTQSSPRILTQNPHLESSPHLDLRIPHLDLCG